MKIAGHAAAFALAVVASACVTTSAGPVRSIDTTPVTTGAIIPMPTAGSTTTTTKPVARVGSTLEVTGSQGTAWAEVVQIIDPASDANGLGPNPGTRYVAVQFGFEGRSRIFDDDADVEATVTGSDGQTYTPQLSSPAGCTNFAYGQVTLASGGKATGCVMFQLPTGVSVATVDYGGRLGGGNIAEWKIG
jgi:hypothetical protein